MKIKDPEKMTYWEMFLALSPERRRTLRSWRGTLKKVRDEKEWLKSLICTLYMQEWKEFMEGAAR